MKESNRFQLIWASWDILSLSTTKHVGWSPHLGFLTCGQLVHQTLISCNGRICHTRKSQTASLTPGGE